jgi:hypothetical protein
MGVEEVWDEDVWTGAVEDVAMVVEIDGRYTGVDDDEECTGVVEDVG